MPLVVPSQVVGVIDQFYGWAKDFKPGTGGDLPPEHSSRMQAILYLIAEIPQNLLDISADDYGTLLIAKSDIEGVIAKNLARGGSNYFPFHVVVNIRRVLAECPDEFPPVATADLAFIPDADLRASIRGDMGAADRAFANAEWKAATVLAGSAIEALLLWAITGGPKADVQAASAAIIATGKRAPHSDPNRWDLVEYATGAHELGIVTQETFKGDRIGTRVSKPHPPRKGCPLESGLRSRDGP